MLANLRCRSCATQTELAAALALRYDVFVLEQGVLPELELDEYDGLRADVVHAAAYDMSAAPAELGLLVGTARLRMLAPGLAKLERLAVSKLQRGQGVGSALVQYLEHIARERDVRQLILNSQASAQSFYANLGYVVKSVPFEEAGILHVAMHKALTPG